ncbi:sec1 family domain-containing protein 1-like [Portunus trituberculatus]|uniref:sec1 family domain-containing protein 1-like n=1 Tax=Portunus trituberculatus TaxID=210409 RepID=UPI001E1CBFE5|nr:sec1 family domain-containing protein 1-like [Portunus trituberculatus]
MASSLREKQIASLRRMINLNAATGSTSVGSDTTFSVLIYDKHGQDIISPLLSVKELREMGVTLHLLLHSERGEVPDVPAIYFCQPTEENLIRIGQDFNDGLYSSYYLNFISPISRQKMEDLALAALQAGCQASIKKVYDQYVNFISLEEDMFTLKHQGSEALSYYAVNRGDVKDSDIDLIMDSIVDSLFSVFVNLGQVPIIRCQRGNAAESVGERLDKKLRENLRDTRNSFFTGLGTDTFAAGQLSFQRPLLVLVDRNVDLATPLHHTWTYQALTHDVLNLSLNRITLVEQDQAHPTARSKTKEYDLNDADNFWATHKGSAFPDVAAAVEAELEEYKKAESHIKGLKADLPGDDAIDLLSDNTAKLTSAITSLPELIKKKTEIDKHMSIAMALLNSIKSRKLDVFFETEEKIMGRATLERPLLEIIKDPDCGSPQDKMRIFLIMYLCAANMTDAEFNEYATALVEADANTKALLYLKRWKSLMKMTAGGGMSEYTGGVAKTVSMFSKLMNQGSALVVEGVNFVLKENKLPLTRIVDHLMELKNSEEEKEYRYFDPKLLRPGDTSGAVPRTRTPFQEAVVMVVGGGNYMEYGNLVSYAKKKSGTSNKRIIYGCTDVVNPEQFLDQLTKLGGEIS